MPVEHRVRLVQRLVVKEHLRDEPVDAGREDREAEVRRAHDVAVLAHRMGPGLDRAKAERAFVRCPKARKAIELRDESGADDPPMR